VAANKSDDETKVFDVASPSETKPDTGSKPMVIGHKSMASDPSITKQAKDSPGRQKVEESQQEDKTAASKKIVLQPISEEKTTDAEDDSASVDSDTKTDITDKKSVLREDSEPEDGETTDAEEKNEETRTPEQKAEADEKETNAREDRLQELIKSQEYKLTIKEASHSTLKTYLITFVVVGLLAVAILTVLADLDFIELGFELPFDVL
jgi:hypothetical protein